MVRPSVILSVRYRNHFPVVQFQNQGHIRNPHGTGQVFKIMGRRRRPPKGVPMAPETWGAIGTPNFLILLPPPKAVQMGAAGTLKASPKAPFPRRASEVPSKAGVSRVLLNFLNKYDFKGIFSYLNMN